MARFLREELVVPEELWQLVARNTDRDEIMHEQHQTADAYVVELSSSKRINVDGFCVQLNYLTSVYRSFFADRERARAFWRLTQEGDQDKIDAYLDSVWSQSDEGPSDIALLRRVRQAITTPEELAADIDTLMSLLPNILFITHVNARTQDGTPIPSRDRFIQQVKQAVGNAGGVVYDPTARMQVFGQKEAIEDYSEGLAHFTDAFSLAVLDDWFDLAVAGYFDERMLSADGADLTAAWTAHFDAMVENGLVTRLGDRLDKLAQHGVFAGKQDVLRYRLAMAEGANQSALDSLRKAIRAMPDDTGLMAQFVELAVQMGLFGQAREVLQQQLDAGVDVPVTTIFRIGLAAGQAGQHAENIAFQSIALRRDPHNTDAAIALAEGGLTHAPDRLATLDPALVATLSRLLPTRLALRLIALKVPGMNFDADVSTLSVEELLDVVEEMHGKFPAADIARMITAWRDAPQTVGTPSAVRLKPITDAWVASSEDPAAGLAQKIALLGAAVAADPHHAKARIALRGLRRNLLTQIRALYAQQDLKALDALATEISDLPEPIGELGLFRARLRFELGEFSLAREIAAEVTDLLPENLSLWALLMRASVKMSDWLATDLYASKVADLSDDESERLNDEAQKRLQMLPAKCFSAARQDDDQYRTIALLEIAARDPALAEQSARRIDQAKRLIIKDIRQLQADMSDAFPFTVARALKVVGDDERLLVAAGRYYKKRRAHKTALPYWKRVLDLFPDNEEAALEMQRCLKKVGPPVSVAE